jgi:hypothetical protein
MGETMPQILAGVLVCAGAYYIYRWLQRETNRVEERMRRAERRVKKGRVHAEAVELRLDPATGVYFPNGK